MKFVQSARWWRVLVVCLLTVVLGLASFWGDTRMGTVYAQDTAEDGTETVEETEMVNTEGDETEGNHTERLHKRICRYGCCWSSCGWPWILL